ncbi:MAG: hypothetical protein K2W92_03005 [Alphaproteobacteria bacterium]|nr:hypothetical protein [Alphaproteobacteria bacterium]
MKKKIAIGLVIPLLFSIKEGSCNYMIEYPDFGVEDPPKIGRRVEGHLNIREIVEDDILKSGQKNIRGINLRANSLTTEGIRYLVNIITNPAYEDWFNNLKYINLTANPVDLDVLEVCRPLLERKEFKYLDICRTTASEATTLNQTLESKFPSISSKIIYIPLRHLNHFKAEKEIYSVHKAYHELNLWD